MQPEQWWKNFSMGQELEVSGRFVYNAMREFHLVENLDDSGASFEVLYGLSVGIERLHKVALVLCEHHGGQDLETFTKTLYTHSNLDLHNRLDKVKPQGLADIQKEFLGVLTKFYADYRYGRFSIDAVSNIDGEHQALRRFIEKHLQPVVTNGPAPSLNDDRTRRFFGKVVQKIVHPLYKAIQDGAHALGLYTYELSSDSKAAKVFLEERLDFVDEDKVRRELLLFLMSDKTKGEHVEFVKSLDALAIDPGLAPGYVKYLLYDTPRNAMDVKEEVIETFKADVKDVKERFEMLGTLDQELYFGDGTEYGAGDDE